MRMNLVFTEDGDDDFKKLESDASKKVAFKAVKKTLLLMETNLRHPSLNAHSYHSLKGPNGEKVFEVYAQQNTPRAYRIFFYYGPGPKMISIVAIIPHPE